VFSIKTCPLPDNTLLKTYQQSDAHTDCYTTDISINVSHAQYVQAFYGTALFKLERKILKWALAKPSSDQDVILLANGKLDTFAVWDVEKRGADQLLMCDHFKRTRSWIMIEAIENDDESIGKSNKQTRLYFGSAVVPLKHDNAGKPSFGFMFHALSLFHKTYSIALLYSAKLRLNKELRHRQ
jgi:hypothetical protein